MNRVLVKDLMERLNQADPNASVELKSTASTFETFDVVMVSPTTRVVLEFDDSPPAQLHEDDDVVKNAEHVLSDLEDRIDSVHCDDKKIKDLMTTFRTCFDLIKRELP